MARLARLVIPGLPYHVTQRGNRRGTTFFEDDDFLAYRELLAEAVRAAGARVWNYGDSNRIRDYGDSNRIASCIAGLRLEAVTFWCRASASRH